MVKKYEVDTTSVRYFQLLVTLSYLVTIHITVQAVYNFRATQTVSKFRATHKKSTHKKLRADVKYKWVASLAFSLLLFISALGFGFPRPAYCGEPPSIMLCESTNITLCEPTNIMLCIFKREITGKGLPRNNEVMRARLAKQQVSDLMAGLRGVNQDEGLPNVNQDEGLPNVNQDEHGKLYEGADVRAFLLDYIQSFKALLQVLAKKGNLPHPNLLLKIVRFIEPVSLDPILNALIIRLRLVRREAFSIPSNHILNRIEQLIPPDFELNSEKKRDLYQLIGKIHFLSKPFAEVLMRCRHEMINRETEQILSRLKLSRLKLLNSPSVSGRVNRTRLILLNSPSVSGRVNRTRLELLNSPSVSGRVNRTMCQLWVKYKPWKKPWVKDQLWRKHELRRKLHQYKKQQQKHFLEAAEQAAFGDILSQQSWDLISPYIELMKNLPPTPNVVMRQIKISIYIYDGQ